MKDRNFRYLCCSNTLVSLLGQKSAAEIVGKTDYDFYPKEIADKFRRDDAAIIATGRPLIDTLVSIPAADGTVHYTRTSKHLLRNTVGDIIGLYGCGRDETANKLLADKAAKQERALSAIMAATPGGIFKYSAESDEFSFVSDTMYEMLGYTPEEFREKFHNRFSEMVWHEDRKQAIDKINADIAKTGTNDSCEYRIETRSGKLKWVYDAGHLITDEFGEKWFVVVIIDNDEQKEAIERLRISEEENRLAIAQSDRVIGRYDVEKRTLTVSAESAKLLSVPEIIEDVPHGRVKRGVISAGTAEVYTEFYESIQRGSEEGAVLYEQKLPAGWRWISARFTAIFSGAHKPVSAIVSFEDVTEQSERESVYKKWQQSLQSRLPENYSFFRCDLSRDGAFDSVEGGLIRMESGAWAQMSFDECMRVYAENYVYSEDRPAYTSAMKSDRLIADYYRGIRHSTIDYREIVSRNTLRWLRRSVELVERPGASGVIAYILFENIDARKTAELEILARAETDPLTGILNRASFAGRADSIIRAYGGAAKHALLMLDIDRFKQINDTYGHSTGDRALVEVASTLRGSLRPGDLVARLGGDEFVVLLNNIPGDEVVANRAKQICGLIHECSDAGVAMSVSVGIAICPRDGKTVAELYRKADRALYHVKYAGRDNYAFYRDEMTEQYPSPENGSGRGK